MPGLQNWEPSKTHVQGGLRPGNYVTGKHIVVCAGPPHLANIGVGVSSDTYAGDLVYPIGLTQNIAISQNKGFSRLFEIGSDRSYFIAGRTVGSLTLSRVVYHGPSLLRVLWAYYNSSAPESGGIAIPPLFANPGEKSSLLYPFEAGNAGLSMDSTLEGSAKTKLKSGLHQVRIPPGYENLYINLASDLFEQPIGLLLAITDNEENMVGSIYLEQCYVPSHSFAVDSQGLIVQESVGIQYERMVPLPGTQVLLLDTILNDPTGSMAY